MTHFDMPWMEPLEETFDWLSIESFLLLTVSSKDTLSPLALIFKSNSFSSSLLSVSTSTTEYDSTSQKFKWLKID